MPVLRHSSPALLLLTLLGCGPTTTQSPSPVAAGAPRPRAVFILIDTGGTRTGQITATEGGGSVVFDILATGLAPGKHGFHLHQAPVCDAPAFEAAGGHFNPTAKQHGTRNPLGPHAGDLPNLTVVATGEGRVQATLPGYTLAHGPNSVATPGTALVIHADPDDELTDPSGNSGARIACAIILLP